MKHPLPFSLAAFIGASLLAVQESSATLLIGYSDFETGTTTATSYTDTTPDSGIVTPGLTSNLYLTTDLNGGSPSDNAGAPTDNNGGSSNSTFADGVTPRNDPGASSVLLLHASNTLLTWTISNAVNSGYIYTLTSLLFDAESTVNSHSLLEVKADSPAYAGAPFNPAVTGNAHITNDTAFKQFTFNPVAPFILNPGESITFTWDVLAGGSGTRIDNIGVTGSLSSIPEPGSLLALGGLVGAGCLLRSRRRAMPVANA